MGNFCIWPFLSDISAFQQHVDGSTPNFICVRTMSADVPPPLWGALAPGGGGGGVKKTQKIGGGLIRA